jgi:intein-encoded DNA endonuclease-like protein
MEKSEFEVEVEDDEISVWSLNLEKLQFSLQTLKKLHNSSWSIIRDFG